MKLLKIMVITALLFLIPAGLFAENQLSDDINSSKGEVPMSIGVMAGYPSCVVLGIGPFEIGIGSPYIAGIYVFADWRFVDGEIPLDNTNPIYWNVGAGLSSTVGFLPLSLDLDVRLPVEFGWTIPDVLDDSLQIWVEFGVEAGIDILPSLDFDIAGIGGVGIRYYF